MSTSFNGDEAGRLLKRLAPPLGQYLELRVLVPDRSPSQFFFRALDEALRVVERFSGIANVYVGACPRFRRRGTKDDVNTVVGFWADLDFHQIDPTDRDLALELAYRRIEALGIPPTILIHTGNGLQLWWLFHEPAALSAEWPAARFESINLGIAKRLGGDRVHDLGRVLRVPGTMNLPTMKKRERGCVPVMARLINADGQRYTPEMLNAFAATAHEAACPRGVTKLTSPTVENSREVLDAFRHLIERVGPHHPLSRTWWGRRRLADGSRSAFDMALACQMARMRIRPELAGLVLRANPFGKGSDATEAYIDRTIDRAYAKCGSRRGH